MNKLISVYNEIVKKSFPSIICILGHDDLVYALNVSIDDAPAFSKFILNGLREVLSNRGFPFHGVVTFSPQATRVKFPEIWEKHQMMAYHFSSQNAEFEQWNTLQISAKGSEPEELPAVNEQWREFNRYESYINSKNNTFSTLRHSEHTSDSNPSLINIEVAA